MHGPVQRSSTGVDGAP